MYWGALRNGTEEKLNTNYYFKTPRSLHPCQAVNTMETSQKKEKTAESPPAASELLIRPVLTFSFAFSHISPTFVFLPVT